MPTTIELSEAELAALGSLNFYSCLVPPQGSKAAAATQVFVKFDFRTLFALVHMFQHTNKECKRAIDEDIPEADAKALYAERFVSTMSPYSPAAQDILKGGERRQGKVTALSRAADGTYLIVIDAPEFQDDPAKSYFMVKMKDKQAFLSNLCPKFQFAANLCSPLSGDSAANRATDFTGARPIQESRF